MWSFGLFNQLWINLRSNTLSNFSELYCILSYVETFKKLAYCVGFGSPLSPFFTLTPLVEPEN